MHLSEMLHSISTSLIISQPPSSSLSLSLSLSLSCGQGVSCTTQRSALPPSQRKRVLGFPRAPGYRQRTRLCYYADSINQHLEHFQHPVNKSTFCSGRKSNISCLTREWGHQMQAEISCILPAWTGPKDRYGANAGQRSFL
jgi:hypothetical protein